MFSVFPFSDNNRRHYLTWSQVYLNGKTHAHTCMLAYVIGMCVCVCSLINGKSIRGVTCLNAIPFSHGITASAIYHCHLFKYKMFGRVHTYTPVEQEQHQQQSSAASVGPWRVEPIYQAKWMWIKCVFGLNRRRDNILKKKQQPTNQLLRNSATHPRQAKEQTHKKQHTKRKMV